MYTFTIHNAHKFIENTTVQEITVHVSISGKYFSLITGDVFHRYYLGITDADVEGVYRSTEGLVTPWAAWDSNEPNGVRTENCVFRDHGRKWDDYNCDNPLEFYCEGKQILGLNIKKLVCRIS